MQVCVNCNTSLSIGIRLHFCPFCGTPQLDKKLIYSKTTKDYDPRNPKPWRYRPWNDIPKIPKRHYVIGNKTNQPWIAVMRKPTRDSKKLRKTEIKSGIEETSTCNNNEDIDVINAIDDVSNNNSYEELKSIDDSMRMIASNTVTEKVVELYRENIYPVAVYEANWLPYDDVIVNISLVEQSLGKSNYNIYWLRVALQLDKNEYEYDDIDSPKNVPNNNECMDNTDIIHKSNQQDDDNNKDELDSFHFSDNDLYVVGMLSNDAAKYMLPNPYDWVELYAINTNEFYMGQHMQKVLYDIALRITICNFNELAIQQQYNVNIRKRAGIGMIYSKYYHNKAQAILNNSIVGNDNHNNNDNKNNINIKKDNVKKQLTMQNILDNIDEYQLWMHLITKLTESNIDHLYMNKQQDNNLDSNNNSNNNSHSKIQSKKSIQFKSNSIMNLKFHDFSIEVTHRLMLTRGITLISCLSRIRLSLYYENKLINSKKIEKIQIHNNNSISNDNNSTSNNDHHDDDIRYKEIETDASKTLKMYAMTDEEFEYTKLVTHLSLFITPIPIHNINNNNNNSSNSGNSNQIVYPTADITFDLLTIQYIFRKDYPKGIDLDQLFALEDKKMISKFVKQLASYIRLEYTDTGIKYAFIGSFSEPSYISCSWPMDQINMDSTVDNIGLDDEDIDLLHEVNIHDTIENEDQIIISDIESIYTDNCIISNNLPPQDTIENSKNTDNTHITFIDNG